MLEGSFFLLFSAESNIFRKKYTVTARHRNIRRGFVKSG